MKRLLLLACCVGWSTLWPCACRMAQAQANAPLSGAALSGGVSFAASTQLQVLSVHSRNLNVLQQLAAQSNVQAVSLDAARAALMANPAALRVLTTWVRNGGTVLLHTDAAQLFGYRTVPVRVTNNRIAGQLFGRARAALPFGGHPILWGSTVSPSGPMMGGGLPGSSTTGAVALVYYQMNPGDHLVLSHPGAVPLLQVTDLAVPSRTPLYASAIASYGNGWALVLPRVVEQQRADGAAFLQNVIQAAGSGLTSSEPIPYGGSDMTGGLGASAAPSRLIPLPSTVLESAANSAGRTDFDMSVAARSLMRAVQPAPGAVGSTGGINVGVAGLMLPRSEVYAVAGLLNSAGVNSRARAGATAMLYVLRARLELQRANLLNAVRWIERARAIAPNAAETLLWDGVVAAGRAEDLAQGSQQRAALLSYAAARFDAAMNAFSLTSVSRGVSGGGISTVGGVPRMLVAAWTRAAAANAALLQREPPSVNVIGDRDNGLLVRFYQGDTAMSQALPTIQALSAATAQFGWRVPNEEVVLFPTGNQYLAYRQQLNMRGQTVPGRIGRLGDVVGSRILTSSGALVPSYLPPLSSGGLPSQTQIYGLPTLPSAGGTEQAVWAIPAVLGRLHAYVYMDALAQGGTPVPAWMQLGLAGMSSRYVMLESGESTTPLEDLSTVAAVGGLLTPAQFPGALLGQTTVIAETQAMRLMMFFYARFGAGHVVETLQRLGSGQSVDEALTATTGLTEQQFFVAWRNAEFT
jgi:hypothetical protein